MRLLYVLVRENKQLLLQKSSSDYYVIPSASKEVDSSYGFDTPEEDNLWFYTNCGMQVFRKYIFFYKQFCVAVFELFEAPDDFEYFLWVDFKNIGEYITDQDQTTLLTNVIKNYTFSKTAPWLSSGFGPYFVWVNSIASQQNFTIIGPVRQIKNAYVSSLFIIPASIGDLYLKIPATTYLNGVSDIEYFLTSQISRLPTFLAISPDKKAYLTKDMGGCNLPANMDAETLKDIVKQWAATQQEYTNTNKLFAEKLPVLHNYTPEEILSNIETFPGEIMDLFEHLDKELDKESMLKLINKLRDATELLTRLVEYKVPNTLCHGDLRPGNIRLIKERFIFYDWGLSTYSHPFYDIAHFLLTIRHQLSDTAIKEIVNTYLAQWKSFESSENLEEIFRIVKELVYFFATYQDSQWLAEILNTSEYEIKKYSLDDWLFSRRAYYFSQVFDRFLHSR